MRNEILLTKGRRIFMIAEYLSGVSTLTLIIHLLDILLVWFLVYKLLSLLKGTRGMQLVKGILIVIGLKIFFNFIGFKTMTYIFEQVVTWGVLGIMIIFQPELRRALEYIGRVQLSNIFNINYKDVQKKSAEHIIKAVVDSSRHMARRRVGALIVLENNTGLDEYVESGITVNAIAPGFINTDMTDVLPEKVKEAMVTQIPLGRMADAEEVATVATFLASDFANYITGQVINVDGGMVM